MKHISLSIAVMSLMLGALACSDKSPAAANGANTGKTAQAKAAVKVDAFLNVVPEETAYFANFDSKTLPAKSVKTLQDGFKSNSEFRKELNTAASSSNASHRFGGLVIGALLDNFVANTFNTIGLAQRPRLTAYGLGLWPVVMVDLKDSAVFEKWLTSVESTAKISSKIETFEGATYRLYPIEKEVASIFAISKGKAVFAIIPTELNAQMLPYVLGQKKAASSLSISKRLKRLMATYGKNASNIAFLDGVELFKTLASKGKGLNKTLIVKEMSQFNLDAVCVTEITQLLETMPMIVSATTTLNDTVTEGEVVWEMAPSLAKDLMTIGSTRAGAGTAASLASIGLAIDSGKVIDLIKKSAASVAAKPYKCSELLELNRILAQTYGQLMFVPPFARAFKAIDINISGWDVGPNADLASSSPRATLVLSAANAPMVFEALKGLVPMLASLPAMTDNGEPVALNQLPLPPYLKAPHIGIGKHAIGLSVGEGEAKNLKTILASGKTSAAPLFSFSYDLDGLMKIIKVMAPSSKEATAALKEFDNLGLTGKSSTTLEITKSGLRLKTRQELSK